MKRLIPGFAAIIMAFCFVAIVKADAGTKPTSYYWFQTQNDGTVINATSVPPLQATDPFGCSTGINGCSKAFTSYQQMGPNDYAPSGTLQVTHKKN